MPEPVRPLSNAIRPIVLDEYRFVAASHRARAIIGSSLENVTSISAREMRLIKVQSAFGTFQTFDMISLHPTALWRYH
jgi:hypothetical protein